MSKSFISVKHLGLLSILVCCSWAVNQHDNGMVLDVVFICIYQAQQKFWVFQAIVCSYKNFIKHTSLISSLCSCIFRDCSTRKMCSLALHHFLTQTDYSKSTRWWCGINKCQQHFPSLYPWTTAKPTKLPLPHQCQYCAENGHLNGSVVVLWWCFGDAFLWW